MWTPDYGLTEIDSRAIGMSTKDAFKCLIDIHRTFKFASGIRETVKYLKRSKSKELTAVDAGTGTGILAILLVAFGVSKVYGIEYNLETFKITQDFITKLGLDNRITLIHGDATNIELDRFGVKDVDILVSENLATGLTDEPQFDIISHISKYLSPEAKILPYKAMLFVQAGFASWKEIPFEKFETEMRNLNDCKKLSNCLMYEAIISERNMEIPFIDKKLILNLREKHIINTLLLSTEFQINDVGKPFYIKPDSCNFLASTWAFKVKNSRKESKNIPVILRYRTGRQKKTFTVIRREDKMLLSD